MSKNNKYVNHLNHCKNNDLDKFSKTGYSNSRLNRHTNIILKLNNIQITYYCGGGGTQV